MAHEQDILPARSVQALAGMPQVEQLLRYVLQRSPKDRPPLKDLAVRCAAAVVYESC